MTAVVGVRAGLGAELDGDKDRRRAVTAVVGVRAERGKRRGVRFSETPVNTGGERGASEEGELHLVAVAAIGRLR